MASPTPPDSCPSCSDTPLAIATSAISFLTLIYALTVGLMYYCGLARNSAKEMNESIPTLFGPFAELESMSYELESMFAQQQITEEMKSDVSIALGRLKDQRSSLLQDFHRRSGKYDVVAAHFPRHAGWSWRIGYLVNRKELQGKLIETDRSLKSYRHIQQRLERIKSDGVEKARWKEHNDMLNLHQKEQENRQLEQLQMLERILRRVIRLEASGTTATAGETTSLDPLPESTSGRTNRQSETTTPNPPPESTE